MKRQGNIKISSENMMPIIKKWLYSDKDIFLREIIANGIDAITKHEKLVSIGEAEPVEGGYRINVVADKKAKTLTVEDNGIGMTEDEVEKYITQIAFSGASDFLDKYEKAGGDGIIGHFGLGFYSAYMVSNYVEIITKSYTGAPAVRWGSDGESTYEIEECERECAGTTVIMHLADGEKEFLDEHNVKALIKKYCSFMPYNIYYDYKGITEEDVKAVEAATEAENGDDKDRKGKKKAELKADKPLNDTCPLYLKNPSSCTDEDYKKFYTDTFMDYTDPVFWVHLNMDYPIKVRGILYFPKVRNKIELERGQVKLYCNQVFIADNIKEVIPEYLMLLNGVIDCPDIPLNVSRSFLQNDKEVQKIAKHITKKVSDKLNTLYKKERSRYEECWDDIANFVKYGCLKDDDFFDKVKDIIIYKDIYDKYVSISELADNGKKNTKGRKAGKGGEDKTEESTETETEEAESESSDSAESGGDKAKTVYYVSDIKQQAQYVKMFRDASLDAICCDTFIDPTYITYLEYKMVDRLKFLRIDAEVNSALKNEDAPEDSALCEIFKSAIGIDSLTVKSESFRDPNMPAIINVDENTRRYSEMGVYYGMSGDEPALTMVVNTANPIVAGVKDLPEDKQKFICQYIYSLALLSYRKLTPEEMDKFIHDNNSILSLY